MGKKVVRVLLVGIALLVVSSVALVGCIAGVSQEEYDAVVAGRDATQAQVATLETELAQAQAWVATFEPDLVEAQGQVAALETKLAEAQVQIEELQAKISTSTPWLTLNFPIPREIQQVNYSQTVESLTVTGNGSPSGIHTMTGNYGNRYVAVSWGEEQTGDIVATLEAVISRKVGMAPVSTSDLYPIPESLIPDDVKLYLQPAPFIIQSDHPEIVALAQTLSQGLNREVDVVTKTLDWISQNVKWGCPTDIENYGSDAVWALENRVGNCVNFVNLTIALLRAQGIPARLAHGVKGYEHSNPGYITPVEGSTFHAWTEVYYPEVGWVRYDATYFSHPYHLPYGIQLHVVPGPSSSPGYMQPVGNIKGASIKWQLIGLGNDKVKLIFTITITRETDN